MRWTYLDHSTPFGQIQAVGESLQGNYSILHIDAHHDLRKAYQGFTHSHASILYNVMESHFAPKSLAQVGIRDFCEEEFDYAKSDEHIHVYYDRDNAKRMAAGVSWHEICQNIANNLTDPVYITCDIDGLSPELCPHTGTPVPGGLSYQQFSLLIEEVAKTKRIIGFDLVEVYQDPKKLNEIDGNIGARVLFELCGWSVHSKEIHR